METIQLDPLPYHEAIRDFLKREESRVWEWFASHSAHEEQAESVRFDLLKHTYRIERDADPGLYALADEVAEARGVHLPITIYQSQNPAGLNASLAYAPDEVHVVFSGPLKTKLSEAEVRAVLAHELTHHALWHSWNGDFLIADQILAALTHDPQAHPAHFSSARLFQLYTEIFCDRGSLAATNDPLVVVSTLVKLATGLDEVHPESYIRQADEIYSKRLTKTAGLTHPETFIRARAIKLWHERDERAADKIAAMIEGPLALDELDLLGQRKVHQMIQRMVDVLVAPSWLQSDLLIAHARLYFPDYSPPRNKPSDEQLVEALCTDDRPLQDYFCYVLLDFATADRELEEAPLAAALQLAERAGLKDRLAEIAKKELRLTKKQFDRIDREKDSLVEFAAREAQKA